MTAISWADYPLFEYEKKLARREIESLVGAFTSTEESLGIEKAEILLSSSTFVNEVNHDGIAAPTSQAKVEASHRAVRQRKSKRQSTRFLVHGLHEYKGKFNPQMARALANVVDPARTVLLDPYCGSGTSLIEGLRLGLDVGGLDRNPLAIWLTRTKLAVLRASGQPGLAKAHSEMVARVANEMRRAQIQGDARTPISVSPMDDAYLRKWFPEEVLSALWVALMMAEDDAGLVAEVVRMTISGLVRHVSWQLPEDLRIRRRPNDWVPPCVADNFISASKQVNYALQEVEQGSPIEAENIMNVQLGGIQDSVLLSSIAPEGRRLVVTSPPYATALPYIDTDRLSIVLLGLDSSGSLRHLEQSLTGSREWNIANKNAWTRRWMENEDELPETVLNLLGRIEFANQRTNAGFRRAAVPPLLYRYFTEMGQGFDSLTKVLRHGERAVFVVGANRTGPRGEQIAIQTPELLGDVASRRGFEVDEIIELETWPRFGLHANNSVNEEKAIVLTRKVY